MVMCFHTGCSKLLENRDEGVGKFPMFKTGLGRSVAVKQSSIAKALSVLGNGADTDRGLVLFLDLFVIIYNRLFLSIV